MIWMVMRKFHGPLKEREINNNMSFQKENQVAKMRMKRAFFVGKLKKTKK